jgi:hypothetical protein
MAKKKSLKKYQDRNSQVTGSTGYIVPITDSSNVDVYNKQKLQELMHLMELERNKRQPIQPMIPSSPYNPYKSSLPPALEHMMKTRRSEGARKGGSIKKKK